MTKYGYYYFTMLLCTATRGLQDGAWRKEMEL